MTREQIEKKAKELGIKYQTPCHGVGDCEFEARQSAIEMAEWLLSHQWVSVEDDLPKEGEIAIVTFIDYKWKRRYATGERTGAGMQVYGIISPSPLPPVTHWMSIPPLAEEGGAE